MKFALDQDDVKEIKSIESKIENHADTLSNVVNEIVVPYCKDLDNYVDFIASCLKDGVNPPTDIELEDFCMNLSTYIYFASGLCEQLGIKDDIAKALYKEMYHTVRNNQGGGTVADKDSIAELESQKEQLVSICYTRAYKVVKAKVENAQELLSSCKKVLSHRMQEAELTKLGGNK